MTANNALQRAASVAAIIGAGYWRKRGVSFEDVVFHIFAGDILETIDHPNQRRYPGQKIHVVAIDDYVYLVPFVESEEEVFLKTIIPSRKATKTYGGTDR